MEESKVEDGSAGAEVESKHEEQEKYDDGGAEGKCGDESKGGDGGPGLIVLRFVILPEGFPHLMSFPRSSSVEAVKMGLATDLQLPADSLVLRGGGLDGAAQSLAHMAGGGVEHEVQVEIKREVAEAAASRHKLADRIEVVVHFEDDSEPSKTVVVDISQEGERKRYLGGYRHKVSGREYHHAETQKHSEVLRERAKVKAETVKYTREAQTAVLATRSAQTQRECGTQMARPDLLLDESGDKEVEAGEYFDSAQLLELQTTSAMCIERYWRGYAARECARRRREARRERALAQRRLREQRDREEKEQHEREVKRRTNPQTAADFEVLYNELDNWRQHETTRIHSTPGLSDAERQRELEELLHKETKLLQTIGKLKLTANANSRTKRIQRLLEQMAAPKQWQMGDGDVTLVHTPFTTRAKELMDLYQGLQVKGVTVDERLDILLHVKWTAKEFDCDLTRDLVDLIDREADLLNRGRSEKAMQGLRKRIATLFLQFVQTPDFNPEAARFQQVANISRPQILPK